MKRHFAPSGPLRGTLRAPGDKSMSHRAALFGAMCADPVHVTGYLDAADTRSTLNADPRARRARRGGRARARSRSAGPGCARRPRRTSTSATRAR